METQGEWRQAGVDYGTVEFTVLWWPGGRRILGRMDVCFGGRSLPSIVLHGLRTEVAVLCYSMPWSCELQRCLITIGLSRRLYII